MPIDCLVFCVVVVVVVSVVFFCATNLTALFNQHTFFIHHCIYNIVVVVSVNANVVVVIASLSAATAALQSSFVILC